MNMQAVVIRSILVLAMSLGVGVVALSRGHGQPQVAHAPVAAVNEPVTLPTVSVRPSAADIAEADYRKGDFDDALDGLVPGVSDPHREAPARGGAVARERSFQPRSAVGFRGDRVGDGTMDLDFHKQRFSSLWCWTWAPPEYWFPNAPSRCESRGLDATELRSRPPGSWELPVQRVPRAGQRGEPRRHKTRRPMSVSGPAETPTTL